MKERRSVTLRRAGDLMRAAITSGAMSGLLPSEPQLQHSFGVGRNIIRDALSALRSEGLIERQQGTGTFVVGRRYSHRVDQVGGFSEEEAGTDVYRVTTSAQLVPAVPLIGQMLGLAPGSAALMVERITIAGGDPTTLWTSYLPPGLEDVASRLGPRVSLHEAVAEVSGSPVAEIRFNMSAAVATESLGEDLGMKPGEPVLRLERTTCLANGMIAEFGIGWNRGDRSTLYTVRRGSMQ